MTSSKKLRVLHCPTTIGGNPTSLARAEREIGLESRSIAFTDNYLQYPADEFLQNAGKPLGGKAFEIKRLNLLMRAIKDFDVIHFNFGSTMMPMKSLDPLRPEAIKNSVRNRIYQKYLDWWEMRDLPILKTFKKAICVTYQGDDARQKKFSLDNFEITAASYVDDDYYPPGSDRVKQERIATFDKYADKIYALNPDLLHVLPERAEFLPYASVDVRDWEPVKKDVPSVPVVLHAPTSRQSKGTDFLIAAVERLRSENIPLKFTLVEGVSNTEARKVYEGADLLVDQLLIGWYGGLAVELMALGKPVICFIREGDLKFVPRQMRDDLPLINANPDTVYRVLKDWLTIYRDRLPMQGAKSRAYVEKWHDPTKIAAKLRGDYEEILASK